MKVYMFSCSLKYFVGLFDLSNIFLKFYLLLNEGIGWNNFLLPSPDYIYSVISHSFTLKLGYNHEGEWAYLFQ